MRKNHGVFWFIAIISIITLAVTGVFQFFSDKEASDFFNNILLGILGGLMVALITVGIDIITTRKIAIKRMLLEVRHIKDLHNELCYAKTDTKIVRISAEIDKHFDYFQIEALSIDWIAWEDKGIRKLFDKVHHYLTNIEPVLIAAADQNADELKEAEVRAQCSREQDMYSIMEIWIPLVKKYDPKSLDGYINYDEWKNKYYKGHAYKTISEIIDEMEKGKKANG